MQTETVRPWVDLTRPIFPGMATWPDNPDVEVTKEQCLAHGDVCNVSKLTLGTHTGTHVDGINHFIKGEVGADAMPLELMVGGARIIDIHHDKQITRAEVEPHDLKAGERVLFRTRNSREPVPATHFDEQFVHIALDAAQHFAEVDVALVGVDYLSVGGFEGNVVDVHQELLGNGIWCVEGLNLQETEPGDYEFLCMPIRLKDGDGALARAIARRAA